MNKIDININLINELELDCYQNLKMLLLENLGRNGGLMGACWPFEFQARVYENEICGVTDIECLREEQFMRFFAVQYRDMIIGKDEDILAIIKGSIDKNIPLIVSFDEFYSFYHYEHIYQKEHGDHAILILGYDDEKEEIIFFSAIPRYYGVMTYQNLMDGLNSVRERHLISIVPNGEKILQEKEIWKEFIGDIKRIKKKYYGSQEDKLKENDCIFVPQLLKILETVEERDEKEAMGFLRNLLQGTWIWHIDRRARLTQKIIKDSAFPEEFKLFVNEYFESVIEKWLFICRRMYKISLNGKLRKFKDVIITLREIETLDMKCFDKICELDV